MSNADVFTGWLVVIRLGGGGGDWEREGGARGCEVVCACACLCVCVGEGGS